MSATKGFEPVSVARRKQAVAVEIVLTPAGSIIDGKQDCLGAGSEPHSELN